MRQQKATYSCGPAALSNAFKAYGRRISEAGVRLHSNTTKEGTDEFGLMAATKALGFHYSVCEETNFVRAYEWLIERLRHGYPVLLCVSNWSHWVTALGSLGSRVTVFDPASDPNIRKENGVYVYSQHRLRRLWQHRTDKQYFAMAIIPA